MANLKLNKNGSFIEVVISVSGQEWKDYTSKSEKKLTEDLEIKGFRKGHVPPAIAKQNIKEGQIWNQAIDLVMDSVYSDAIQQMIDAEIATRPSLAINKVTAEEVELTLKAPKMPEAKIGDISKVDVKLEIEKVTEEELAPELDQLNAMFEKNEVVEGAKVENGDLANIDFLGKKDGVAFDGGEAQGFDLKIGSKSFIDNFEDQLIGMAAGEEKTITVTFPETYPQEELAGQPATFDVKVNSVKRATKLVGEELEAKLKQLGFKSVAEIEEKVRALATERKEQDAKDTFFRKFVDAVLELDGTEIEFAEEILANEVESEFKNFENQLAQQGMKVQDYLKMLNLDLKDFKNNQLKVQAEKRLKDSLIYSKLIKDLSIELNDEDFEKEFEKISKDSNLSIEDVKKQISKEQLESSLVYNKLIETLSK